MMKELDVGKYNKGLLAITYSPILTRILFNECFKRAGYLSFLEYYLRSNV